MTINLIDECEQVGMHTVCITGMVGNSPENFRLELNTLPDSLGIVVDRLEFNEDRLYCREGEPTAS